MNYNNFASRISIPRVVTISAPAVSPQKSEKKPRQRARRVLANAAAALILVLSFSWKAEAAEARPAALPPTAFSANRTLPEASGDLPAPSGESAPASMTPEILRAPLSFGFKSLSPTTELVLAIGLAVAAIQSRLLLGRRDVVW